MPDLILKDKTQQMSQAETTNLWLHTDEADAGAVISQSVAAVKCWLIVWDIFYCSSAELRRFTVRVIN